MIDIYCVLEVAELYEYLVFDDGDINSIVIYKKRSGSQSGAARFEGADRYLDVVRFILFNEVDSK